MNEVSTSYAIQDDFEVAELAPFCVYVHIPGAGSRISFAFGKQTPAFCCGSHSGITFVV